MKKYLAYAVISIAVLTVFFNINNETINQKIMAITRSTMNLIAHFEGKENKAYQDSKGLWTIGVGHLIKPDEEYLMNAVLTDQQVEDLFKRDLKWCDEAVNDSVRAPLSQNQYDALYSLCFNIGADHFKQSEVVHHINKLDYMAAANAFLNWSNPPVLKKRRERERAVFLADI
jgi:lysozyme